MCVNLGETPNVATDPGAVGRETNADARETTAVARLTGSCRQGAAGASVGVTESFVFAPEEAAFRGA